MSADKPLVSVIVPSYNHENFVKDCIESIVNQTYKNIELFVIDDGSKDNTPNILKELSAKYNFYFEQQENMGVIKTTNKLLKMCNGKYITILASDDVWLLDKLDKQVAFMEQNSEISACFGNELAINDKGEVLANNYQKFIGYTEYFFEDIIKFNARISAPTNLYRSDVYQKLGYYDTEYILEDFYLHLKMTANNMKIVVLPYLFTFYRQHSANFSNKGKFMFKVKLKHINQYKWKRGYVAAVVKLLYYYFTDLILSILK